MDPMEDPEQIAKLNAALLVTLYESRATSLGRKTFMVQQALAAMTFEGSDDDSMTARTKMFDMISKANGVPHDQEILSLYRNELTKRLASG